MTPVAPAGLWADIEVAQRGPGKERSASLGQLRSQLKSSIRTYLRGSDQVQRMRAGRLPLLGLSAFWTGAPAARHGAQCRRAV